MASGKENAHSIEPTSPPSAASFRSKVFPPLPPNSPPVANDLSEDARKAARGDAGPREFGVRTTNTLNAGGASHAARKTESNSPSSNAMVAAQRYYHQYQYFPQHGILRPKIVEKKKRREETVSKQSKNDPWSSVEQTCCEPRPGGSGSEKGSSPLQFGRTIWSITPEELSALEVEMVASTKKEKKALRRFSYAEASKRNLPEFAKTQAERTKDAMKAEQPRRQFKKYYGLPFIAPSEPYPG
ncbi:unnamed protein product [Phytophthora lilii]|uniref:Unnamed protein product n=1 Tax=Phytophthora lilii TaxID=2077276 RepID=A0A9W6WSB0_9STRA|nr:unnamed protein product [Phytophthora lilii]